jgi:UDP-N-acetyl-D-mannosaminuronic acid transferase (WecB/TagA/CpsF family)
MVEGRAEDVEGDAPGVPASFNVLGVRIDALTLDRAVALTARRIALRAPAYVSVCTVNDVVEALADARCAAALAGSWLAT